MYKLSWHFDFHSHKNIRINCDPDVPGLADALKECGVEEIITFAKGHDGFAYYPTAVGTPHPRMTGDAFGDVVKACKSRGIRVLAYVSFGVDGEAGRKHNEWAQVQLGGPVITEDWFVDVCPFTPYLEKMVLPMIEEILQRYPVDGFFFDTMGAMAVCYCAWCKEQFLRDCGLEIPAKPGDPGWGVYGKFRRERLHKVVAAVAKFIAGRKPGAKVGFNHLGSIHYPERMPEGITCLTLDFTTSGPQSMQSSLCAAYGSTSDLPSDVMSTIFNQGWGDWSPRPFPSLEQTSVATWARKCRPYLGDRLHPANKLSPVSLSAMRFMAGVAKRVAKEYPSPASKLVPDILILHSPRKIYGDDMSKFAIDTSGIRTLAGAHHLFLDAGANFGIVGECYLERHLRDCKLVVVPETSSIESVTGTLLKGYVESGGKLLIAGGIPRAGNGVLDWTGVAREDKPWQDHVYLPSWDASDGNSPVLVRGDFNKLRLKGADAVLHTIRPHDCEHGVRFGWGIGPASDEPGEFPALTRFRLGRGEVWYLEPPVFSDYDAHANWTQIKWFRGLLNRMIPRPVAQVISDSGTVEVVAHADGSSTWAFLINHGGEQINGARAWARTFGPVPPFPVTLRIRDGAGRRPESVTTKDGVPEWTFEDGAVHIPVIMDSIWRVVRVSWK